MEIERVAVLGWDVEIADEFPEGEGERNWLEMERGLGITCASVALSDGDVLAFTPFGSNVIPHGSGGDRMSPSQARGMADWLIDVQTAGGVIVTWNGLGFDFPVLARECESEEYTRRIADLAMNHCDLGFSMLADKGYMVGLNTAAHGLGLSGKTEGMHGDLAPILWNPPERELTDQEAVAVYELGVTPGTVEARQLCVDYVKQDAVTTLEVYQALDREGQLLWITRSGRPARYPWIPGRVGARFRLVKEDMRVKPPDTSWMDSPRRRSDYIGWALEVLGLDHYVPYL